MTLEHAGNDLVVTLKPGNLGQNECLGCTEVVELTTVFDGQTFQKDIDVPNIGLADLIVSWARHCGYVEFTLQKGDLEIVYRDCMWYEYYEDADEEETRVEIIDPYDLDFLLRN